MAKTNAVYTPEYRRRMVELVRSGRTRSAPHPAGLGLRPGHGGSGKCGQGGPFKRGGERRRASLPDWSGCECPEGVP